MENDLITEFLNRISIVDKYFLNISNLPNDIYHYTDLSSIKSIVEKPCLWATNCMFLNDNKEIIHLKPIVEKVLKELYSTQKDFEECLLSFYNAACDDILKSIFVISFSNKRDSLTLWSNYTNNDGYCIIFSNDLFLKKDFMIEEQDVAPLIMGRNVIYDNLYKEKLIIQIVEIIFDYYKKLSIENFQEFMHFAIVYLLVLAFFTKDKNYEDEHEFRLVISLLDGNIHDIEFRIAHGLIIPFIKVCFPIKYIKEIMIGPKRKMEITRTNLEYFLSSKGFNNIKISESSIPLRY